MSSTFLGLPRAVETGPLHGSEVFPTAARRALADTQLRRNLGRATGTIRAKRAAVVGEVPDWAELRAAGAAIKDATLAALDEHLLRLEAEVTARHILRNSQIAVRSAKETILDVIGRPLDEQLRIDALNGWSSPDPEETKALLGRFYEKTDAGRAGTHKTEL